MKTFRKHILFSVTAAAVFAGLLCLNLHDITHLREFHPETHQTESDTIPVKKSSDDCVMCLVSAFGFAEPDVEEFLPVQTGSEQTVLSALSFPVQQPATVAAPRAPPLS